MNERDRLAADLHREACPIGTFRRDDDWRTCSASDHGIDAARLIALGWTRLDEERLARALDGYDEGVMQDKAELWARGKRGTDWFAAAIAKAYREDTDAD